MKKFIGYAICLCLLWVLYAPSHDGRIYHVVKDKDWYYFEHSTNVPLVEYHIEENEVNKALAVDMIKVRRKVDKDNDQKYRYNALTAKIEPKKDWVEKVPEDIAAIEAVVIER